MIYDNYIQATIEIAVLAVMPIILFVAATKLFNWKEDWRALLTRICYKTATVLYSYQVWTSDEWRYHPKTHCTKGDFQSTC